MGTPANSYATRKIYGIGTVCQPGGRFWKTMWCRQCGQDVPGRLAASGGEYCCPRCHGVLGSDAAMKTATAAPPAADPSALRRLGAGRATPSHRTGLGGQQAPRRARGGGRGPRDLAGGLRRTPGRRPGTFARPPDRPGSRSRGNRLRQGWGLGLLIGTALTLGPLAVIGGGALLGWSLLCGPAGPVGLRRADGHGRTARRLARPGAATQPARRATAATRPASSTASTRTFMTCGRPPRSWVRRTAPRPPPSTPTWPTAPARRSC